MDSNDFENKASYGEIDDDFEDEEEEEDYFDVTNFVGQEKDISSGENRNDNSFAMVPVSCSSTLQQKRELDKLEEKLKTFQEDDSERIDTNKHDQGNQGRSGGQLNRHCGPQGGKRQQQSLPSEVDNQGTDIRGNEEENAKFEPKKLLVCGLTKSTTDDGVLNFIEAISREEVEKVDMLRNGKALVTMNDNITNFSKIKEKGEKRGMNTSQVTLHRVPVCRSILVSGISDDTTHHSIELYFESLGSSGGPVEKVLFKPKSGQAVVVFQDFTDMERVLARQSERLHVLNDAQLTVRIFNDLLEDCDNDALDHFCHVQATAGNDDTTSVGQLSELQPQQLYMVVDPDVMEYVTTSSFYNQFKEALAAKATEINWKLNSRTALVLYRGEDKCDSWQSECVEEIQEWLRKFTKRDVEIKRDFLGAVKAQLPGISACFGVEPPLVKMIDDSFVIRVVSLNSNAEDLKETLKLKLEKIYEEESRKTYLQKKEDISVEHLTLLKKIRFVEKLREKYKELEITIDTDAEEIQFEGPRQQLLEATMKLHEQISGMVEIKLSLSRSILEGLEKGLEKVTCELEKNKIEAVFVIDGEAWILGTSRAHADKAGTLLSKLTLEQKVLSDEKSQHLMKTSKWRELCQKLNTDSAVRVHRTNLYEINVAGFREDVSEAIKTLTAYLDNNCIEQEHYKCPSKMVRKYLSELRQEDLGAIEVQLQEYEIKIQTGKGDDDMVISGKKEGLKIVRANLKTLIDSIESKSFYVQQPDFRKCFASAKWEHLVTSIRKDYACVIHIQEQDDMRSRVAKSTIQSDPSSNGYDKDKTEEDVEDAVGSADPSSLVEINGHKILWKPGNIETEPAHILVSSQGACHQAIANAGGPKNVVTPNTGDVTVTPGYELTCKYVIHTNCSKWDGGKGEQILRSIVQKCLQKADELGGTSIAFPVIGTGNLNFPPDTACRIMLEEVTTFCQTSRPLSSVKYIRFAVFHQDQTLITAFAQAMSNLKSKYEIRPAFPGRLIKHLRSRRWKTVYCQARPTEFSDEAKDERDSDSSSDDIVGGQPKLSPPDDHSVKIYVVGKRKESVGKAVDALKKGFSEARRTQKLAGEGIHLPLTWAPMPRSDMTVHTVTITPGSSEYQNVMNKVQKTAAKVHVQKIERLQNPHLYKQYMVRKQKMDKDNGGNNERQLFHGTDAKNIRAINTQGFNRSFSGEHGIAYGQGVYFARDASYSVRYAGTGRGAHYLYLARVLVGKYCQGNSDMKVPPPKNSSRPEILYDSVVDDTRDPSIFVVFYDAQCYPEYLITF